MIVLVRVAEFWRHQLQRCTCTPEYHGRKILACGAQNENAAEDAINVSILHRHKHE